MALTFTVIYHDHQNVEEGQDLPNGEYGQVTTTYQHIQRATNFYGGNRPKGATILCVVMDEGEPYFWWLDDVKLGLLYLERYYRAECPWVFGPPDNPIPFSNLYQLFKPV